MHRSCDVCPARWMELKARGGAPPVSSRIMASVSFTDYGPGKERTSSAPSAWVNTRVCTLTRNEVEDEVVQKVVYSINGAAKTHTLAS